MAFSDRIGITKPKTVLQVDQIDSDLRAGIWQACLEGPFRVKEFYRRDDEHFSSIIETIYVDHFKRPVDEIPVYSGDVLKSMRPLIFDAEWWKVYNFIEFLLPFYNENFHKRLSFFLEREKSAYRIIDDRLIQITDTSEIAALQEAATLSDKFSSPRQHLASARDLFSQKPNADYRNSIKESISAVEAIVRILTGSDKATLGEALKLLDSRMPIHGALKDAMSKLYGYTSDAGGIRHALTEGGQEIDEAEAKFMLVTCSAFVNFCVQRSSE